MEVENFKKRIESNKKDTDAVKQSFGNKKTASDVSIRNSVSNSSRYFGPLETASSHKHKHWLLDAETCKYNKIVGPGLFTTGLVWTIVSFQSSWLGGTKCQNGLQTELLGRPNLHLASDSRQNRILLG